MKDIQEYLNENQQEMLEVLENLISFPSTQRDKEGDYPFGEPVAKCLDYALKVCDDYGFKTKNLDYYAGFGEIGQGKEVIGIAGHLDIVPEGTGWDSDPFVMTIKDEKMFGRGSSDNKGPTVAALFAVKYLLDNDVPLNKRIRMIFGCNEESGMDCVKYYLEKEGHFDIGFSPDGPFPCCFGEKGIINFTLTADNNIFTNISGGVARNVVPESCELGIKAELVDKTKLEEYLKDSPLLDFSIDIKDDILNLKVNGRAAHASTPELGINSISYALCALKAAGAQDAVLDEFVEKINTSFNGDGADVHLKDQYGDLTFNVGLVELVDDKIVLTIDIRCPFTYDNDVVIDGVNKAFSMFTVGNINSSPGLYHPEDSDIVQMFTSTYNEVMNCDEKPVSMGGGTYARIFNNTLAFGPSDKKTDDTHIHDANEFMRIETLMKCCEIYIKTIIKMLEL